MSEDITLVPGVAETALDTATRAALPDTAPPAPWRCTCDAVVWVARPNRAAAAAVEPAIARRGRIIAVVGGLVRYRDTPVGGYDEVLGAVALAGRGGVRASVPFMAVDSPASVVGGRANWSLPKTRAEFTGTPGSAMTAKTAGWSVRAEVVAVPGSIPVRTTGKLIQQWPDGVVRGSALRSKGRASPALVRVTVESDHRLPEWLRSGWHPGVVLRDVVFTLDKAGDEAR